MNKLSRGFESIPTYIDDLLIIKMGDCSDQFEKLEQTPQKIKDNGIKCNIENSFFGKTIWNI